MPARINRLAVIRERPDILRVSGRLDLNDPLVLTTPDTAGRYFVLWLRDAWNTVFASIGALASSSRLRQRPMASKFSSDSPIGSMTP